ncbi:hypothetical protein ASPWEDRAFT_36226 [Aspergillus wentii DTO 134E9]|uniref:Uncharacterized protein n=1 Tax=Aspergillus wentii DTO 134E9 TaxID=1073089 RepID=A0A1L9RUH6_ASPWE|nr:uncharacterized protein ASPWEDRAFT_36226 [Aspergillus wentii DTO 134E9]OJJ38554.1 hypothetical protein ASPWEDRAFT_36226 [Aspergillus wentii DTO 134E9]
MNNPNFNLLTLYQYITYMLCAWDAMSLFLVLDCLGTLKFYFIPSAHLILQA